MATVNVYCIDNSRSDWVYWIDSALTARDIGIASVADMVQKISALCASGDRIGELRIAGHGNRRGQFVGANWLDDTTLMQHRFQLSRLSALFASRRSSLVSMGGCRVGQNEGLLLSLSQVFGVTVRGWTARQRPLVPGDEGNETRCLTTCSRTSAVSLWDWLDN
jgi:hypothetical protein